VKLYSHGKNFLNEKGNRKIDPARLRSATKSYITKMNKLFTTCGENQWLLVGAVSLSVTNFVAPGGGGREIRTKGSREERLRKWDELKEV